MTQARSSTLRTADALLLMELFDQLLELHEALLEKTLLHSEAMKRADANAMAISREQIVELCAKIAAKDHERQSLVHAIMPEQPGATLTDVANTLEAPHRAEALDKARTLKRLIEDIQTENNAIRGAAWMLLGAVRSMVEQIGHNLNHARTYSRSGSMLRSGQAVVSGIDLSS